MKMINTYFLLLNPFPRLSLHKCLEIGTHPLIRNADCSIGDFIFASNLFAQHRRCCRKDSLSCDHCPVDASTRVEQLVKEYDGFRGLGADMNRERLLTDYFTITAVMGQNQCIPYTLNVPSLLPKNDITMLHDEDWIKVNRDGSVTATFTYVLNADGIPGTFVFKDIQLWVPTEGQCNYKLKHEA